MEEDTAKLIHKEIKGKTVSLVDFNRSGVPLVEIVTEPDLETPEETKEFLKKIHHTIKTLDVSNADMEKGSMRLEANISIGDSANLPDYKVEIKNVNSFRYITNAISFEINRQAKLLKEGETPLQETRGWDRINGKTFSQRKKESADDYRYFPEPDILPIVTSNEQIEKLRSKLPQLPTEIIKNLTNLKIELRFAKHISQDKKIVDIIHELASDKQIDSNKLASLFVNAKLNPTDTSQSVKDSYLKQTKVGNTDQDLIGKLVKKVVGESEQAVLAYKQGNQNAIGPLIGKVIALSGGKVDPVTVRQSLVKTLSS